MSSVRAQEIPIDTETYPQVVITSAEEGDSSDVAELRDIIENYLNQKLKDPSPDLDQSTIDRIHNARLKTSDEPRFRMMLGRFTDLLRGINERKQALMKQHFKWELTRVPLKILTSWMTTEEQKHVKDLRKAIQKNASNPVDLVDIATAKVLLNGLEHEEASKVFASRATTRNLTHCEKLTGRRGDPRSGVPIPTVASKAGETGSRRRSNGEKV